MGADGGGGQLSSLLSSCELTHRGHGASWLNTCWLTKSLKIQGSGLRPDTVPEPRRRRARRGLVPPEHPHKLGGFLSESIIQEASWITLPGRMDEVYFCIVLHTDEDRRHFLFGELELQTANNQTFSSARWKNLESLKNASNVLAIRFSSLTFPHVSTLQTWGTPDFLIHLCKDGPVQHWQKPGDTGPGSVLSPPTILVCVSGGTPRSSRVKVSSLFQTHCAHDVFLQSCRGTSCHDPVKNWTSHNAPKCISSQLPGNSAPSRSCGSPHSLNMKHFSSQSLHTHSLLWFPAHDDKSTSSSIVWIHRNFEPERTFTS